MRWAIMILVGWILTIGYSVVVQLAPASIWFEVHSVTVEDTTVGVSPKIDPKRVIHHPFSGVWVAQILPVVENETYAPICWSTGKNTYTPGNELPPDPDLDWWTWPVKCRPGGGQYILETTWTIKTDLFPDKRVTIRSNVFTISEE